jgi:hypothetical protein
LPKGKKKQKQQQPTYMSKSVAELNQIAQEIANKLGHISQELLFEVHALVHKEDAAEVEAPKSDA